MRKLTNDGSLTSDDWAVLPKDEAFDPASVSGPTLVHWSQAQDQARMLEAGNKIGIWIDTETPDEALASIPLQIPVIAIHIPTFTDGRGFSLARMLREQRGFTGEIRALGNYIQDQLFYMRRCGFDAYIIEEIADAESMRRSLMDFSDSYQAAVDQPQPLFRRRSSSP